MLTVACVLKSGGIYDAAWVARLQAMVKRHLPLEHRFVCLSDCVVPCDRIPLENNWPGWWSKIELFKLDGPVLYFDLDTAIVGDLSDIADVASELSPGKLVALRDFYRPFGVGSGVLGFNDCLWLFDRFAADPDHWQARIGRRGDQGYIEDVVHLPTIGGWQDILLGQIVSYKVHCRAGIPSNARVVCLHGEPKFPAMPLGDPVRYAWEHAA